MIGLNCIKEDLKQERGAIWEEKVRKKKKTFDFGEMGFWICAIVIAIGWFWGK